MATGFRQMLTLAGATLLVAGSAAEAKDLRGSPSSMQRQHRAALAQDYTFMRSPTQVERMAELGRVEPIEESRVLALSKVSYPFARPEVREFAERLAGEYFRETGERLVITSLTRPQTAQPGNAHRLSVHPAGMAVDLRVPKKSGSRAWLEERLLELESAGVIDATRERYPPHYHIAVFGEKYTTYAQSLPPLAPLPPEPVAPSTVVARAVAEAAGEVEAAIQRQAQDAPSNGQGAVTLALAMLVVGGTIVRRHAARVMRVSRRASS